MSRRPQAPLLTKGLAPGPTLLLVSALLLCHGLLGSLHVVHDDAAPGTASAASHGEAAHEAHGASGETSRSAALGALHGGMTSEYAAVLYAALLGALLALRRLPLRGPSRGLLVAEGTGRAVKEARAPLPRGTTLSRLQVFRL